VNPFGSLTAFAAMKNLYIPLVNALFIVSILLTPYRTFCMDCTVQNEEARNLDSAVERLKKSAGSGTVRVILKVKLTSQDSEDSTSEPKNKTDIIALAKEIGVTVIEPIKGQPLVVMELNAEQIDTLAESDLIRLMYEDRIEGAF
jgi:hypothetical protein